MTSWSISALEYVFQYASVAAAILGVIVGALGALRSGKVKALRVAGVGVSVEEGITAEAISTFERRFQSGEPSEKPFETVALSNYYNHALSRANVSFWFSIIFASIGFGVIILAFATHNPSDIWGTVIKTLSGTVIDSVSALFFVQSTAAQKSMSEFFEKLRLDRLNAEARSLIGEIENEERRDQLRAQLVLKYSGIEKLLIG